MTAGRQAGRTALVTGAARGQGRAHAVRLADEGASIIALDICRDIASVPYGLATPEDLAETARLVETAGAKIFALASDTRDRDGLAAAIDAGVAEFGRLDLVVANAGIFCGAGEVGTTTAAWQDTIDVNLTGTYNTLEAAVPHLRAGGRGGSIVITSSAGGVKATALDMDAAGKSVNQNAIPVAAIEPDDVADAVAWLLSDEARYVTGVALPVDAGMMLI
jgi:NAD(P)-dependent dehydrogenase (short-subunit alcohol dehydrogenase family)